MLPASVGVKNPTINPPITTRKITPAHMTGGREAILSFQVDLSVFGPREGLILHQPMMMKTKNRAISNPE